jgi:Fe-S cluster assembly iron-binding protein IscA
LTAPLRRRQGDRAPGGVLSSECDPRISARSGQALACSGAISFVSSDSPAAPGDHVIQEGGARVFGDSEAAPMLDNAELDAQGR